MAGPKEGNCILALRFSVRRIWSIDFCQPLSSGYLFKRKILYDVVDLNFYLPEEILCIIHSVFRCLTFFVCVGVFVTFFPPYFCSNGGQEILEFVRRMFNSLEASDH